MTLSQKNTQSLLTTLIEHVTLLQELVVVSINTQHSMGKLVVTNLPGIDSKERQLLMDRISLWESRMETLDAHMASIKANLAQIQP